MCMPWPERCKGRYTLLSKLISQKGVTVGTHFSHQSNVMISTFSLTFRKEIQTAEILAQTYLSNACMVMFSTV